MTTLKKWIGLVSIFVLMLFTIPLSAQQLSINVQLPDDITEQTHFDKVENNKDSGGIILYDKVIKSSKNRDHNLYRIHPDGTNKKLIFSRKLGFSIAVSPNGRKIANAKYTKGAANRARDIWVLNIDGTGEKRITDYRKWTALNPVWAKGGSMIFFESNRPSENEPMKSDWDLFSVNINDSNVSEYYDFNIRVSKSTWSPDRTKIAFVSKETGKPQLYVMNADGSNLRKLTDSSTDEPLLITWHPDNNRILFGYGDLFYNRVDYYMVNINDGDIKPIVKDAGPLGLSPDGSKIVYYVSREGVFIANTDGSNKHPIPLESVYILKVYSSFIWSPDGEQIAFGATFSRNNAYHNAILIIDDDGGNLKVLTDENTNKEIVLAWVKD